MSVIIFNGDENGTPVKNVDDALAIVRQRYPNSDIREGLSVTLMGKNAPDIWITPILGNGNMELARFVESGNNVPISRRPFDVRNYAGGDNY
jgi:hypothetical protein